MTYAFENCGLTHFMQDFTSNEIWVARQTAAVDGVVASPAFL